jgi:hypothetical protein
MTQNDHIRTSAIRLGQGLQACLERGYTVAAAHIGARNPLIELAEPPRDLSGATRVRAYDGKTTILRQVAVICGCQTEWEIKQ